MSRVLFFDEDDARGVARALADVGHDAVVSRERFAGEDDDEAAHWVVTSDAPEIVLELATEDLEAWVEYPDPPAPAPLDLPLAPRRIKKENR